MISGGNGDKHSRARTLTHRAVSNALAVVTETVLGATAGGRNAGGNPTS